MKLWDYLESKMQFYKDRIAIYDLGLTYADILGFSGVTRMGTLCVCDGTSNAELAVNILKCLAAKSVAVPITNMYGEARHDYVCNNVLNDKSHYNDLSFVMFTSGTTGQPKGVMLTDENIITNLEYISDYFDVSDARSICISRSLTHIAALTGEFLYALINGLTIYFYEDAFNPVGLARYLNENAVDVFCSTPTVFYAISRFVKFPINLRVAAISGERLTAQVALKLFEKFPLTQLYNVYGLTEHSPRAAALLPKDFYSKFGSIYDPHVCVCRLYGAYTTRW